MSVVKALSTFNSWATIRCELLNTRICDLGLDIVGSPLEPSVDRLGREMAAKGMKFRPSFYLTDSWGCPDEVPVIGIPFYLADKRLVRIEEEQTGESEDGPTIMSLLRHEAGHAVNYAYRLWETQEWQAVFGPFAKPYRDSFRAEPTSKAFVRHIFTSQYGHTYAQKHPDEDFAETFAIWLTPRSGWRRKYRHWPAMRKLQYVERTLRRLGGQPPGRLGRRLYRPLEELTILLAEHYGQRAERFRAAAQGYVDDQLREVFPPIRSRSALPAQALLRKHHRELRAQIIHWAGLDEHEADSILTKLEDRAAALRCRFPRGRIRQKLIDTAALATALGMEFAYTGRLTT